MPSLRELADRPPVRRALSLLRRPWVVMPLVAVVGLLAYLVFRPADDGGAATQQAERVVEATQGTMSQTVTAEGTLEAAQTDDLSFTAAGEVTAVNVEAGDTVTAGQVLATLDSVELQLAVAEAEASLADAEATLSDDQDAGESDAQIAADQSTVESARDALAEAQEDLAGSQLVASFDGTVASVDLVVGEQLGEGGASGTDASGSESGSGDSSSTLGEGGVGLPGGDAGGDSDDDSSSSDPHVQVVDTSAYTVELGFDEADWEQLEAGQDATVSLSTSSGDSGAFPGGGVFPGGGAFPGGGTFPGGGGATEEQPAEGDAPAADAPAEAPTASTPTAEGLVWEVGQVADASSGVAQYPVTVLFEDPEGDFDAGATVSVDIAYAEVEDAVQVPSFAISEEDGVSTVTVRTDDGDETREVTTGLVSGTMTQITEGLEAGEQVVISAGDRAGAFPGGGGEVPEGIELPEGFELPDGAVLQGGGG